MPSVQHREATIRSRQNLFETVVAHLEEHLDDPDLQVDDVARAVFASRRQVQRVMGEHDTTFRERLTDLRMARAGELLARHPRLSIRMVAAQVGYRQPAQFAKAFRRHFGRTPTEHRVEASSDEPARALAA